MRRWSITFAVGLVLSSVIGSVAAAAVPGANGKVAFVRGGEVYTVNADGSDARNLTNHPAADYSPSWSPDGARIAFASDRDGVWRIYVMNRDGSEPRPITAGPWDRAPSWSPDGARIVFNRSLAIGGYLYSIAIDGLGEVELARPNVEVRAAWFPDGRELAFTSVPVPLRILVMNADGTDQRPLHVPAEGLDPDFSPDGQRFAFTRGVGGGLGIFTMNRDGSDQVRVTPTDAYRPAWSPDGSKLAFVSGDQLKIVGSEGAGERVLATGVTGFFGKPDWQPATDVGVAFASRPKVVRVGGRAIYTLKVTNQSTRAAESVHVALRLTGTTSKLLSRAVGQGSCTGTRLVNCSLGTLAPSAATTVRVTLQPGRSGVLALAASAATTTPDASTRNDLATVRTTVRR